MKIDHIGFVVEEIEKSSANFQETYGYSKIGDVVIDQSRNVKLLLLNSENGYCLELIQPLNSESPSYEFMKKGGGMHHVCYCVNNLNDAIDVMKKNNHVLIHRSQPAVLFDNRKVAFLYSKIDRQIIELLEK